MAGRSAKRWAAACLTICLSLGLAGIASAAVPVRVVSPQDDQLISSKTFRVVVQGGKRLSKPRIEVSGRDVSSRFERRGSNGWTARLNRSALRTGANEISVSAKAGEDRGFAVVKVFKGMRDSRLLRVHAPRKSITPVDVRFATRREADLFVRAKLNRRDASPAFGPEFGKNRRAKLSPSYGLRYGKNRLRIRVARSDGTFDLETRTILVPRTKPLASAGRDRLIRGGGRVRLDGTATKATRRGAKLSYRWKLTGRPNGSKARIKGVRRARPAFRADRVGTYRARLTVAQKIRTRKGSKRFRTIKSSDVVEVTSGKVVPPLGLPINTLDSPGGQGPGISYDGRFSPVNFEQDGVQAMLIDRTSGQILFQQTVPGSASDAAALSAQISSAASTAPLVVISVSNFKIQPDPAYNQIVKQLTGTALSGDVFQNDSFSVIGIPGSPGAAWSNGGWTAIDPDDLTDLPGALNGFLQLDSSGNLTFVPGPRYAVDSSATGAPAGQNAISIAGRQYPSGPLTSPSNPAAPCGTGGFQVQSVDAEYATEPGNGRTFTTNGCGASEDAAGQQQMADFLTDPATFDTKVGGQVFVIQSIGDPRGANDSNWPALTKAIGAIGGNPWLFGAIDPAGDSFAMITGAYNPSTPLPGYAVAQSAQHDTGKEAHVTAVLKQGRSGFLDARQASATNTDFAFGLHLLTYQQTTGPAFPDASTAEDLKALRYIADEVLDLPAPQQGVSCYVPSQPDVRSEYCNPNVTDRWASNDQDGYTQRLTAAAYPGEAAGFSEATWNSLRCDFVGLNCSGTGPNDEWGLISQVWADFSALKGFVLESSSGALADANLTAQQVRDSVARSERSLEGLWIDLFANIATGVSYLPIGSAAQLVTGELSTAGLLAEDWVNGTKGTPVLNEFDDDAATFLADLSSTFTSSFEALDHSRDIVLTDVTKLNEMANGDYVSGNLSSGLPAFTFGTARFAYETLLPAAYGPVRLERNGVNAGITDARLYQCGAADLEVSYYAFPDAPDSAQWLPAGGNLHTMVLDGAALPNGESRIRPAGPTDALMKPLFEPYATDSTNVIPTQFGFTPETFYPETWDLSKIRSVDC